MQVCVVGFCILIVVMCILSFANFQNIFGGKSNYQTSTASIPAQVGYPVIVDFTMKANNGTLLKDITMPVVAGGIVNSTQYLSDADGNVYAIHADEYNAISQGVLGHVPGETFTVNGPGMLDHVYFVKKAEVEGRGLNYTDIKVGTVIEMNEEYTTNNGNTSYAKLNVIAIDKSDDVISVQYAPDTIDVKFVGYYQTA